MEHEGKEKSPYKGIFVSCFFMIFVPVGCFALFAWLLPKVQDFSAELNRATAQTIGFGIGVLYDFIGIFSGAFKDGAAAVAERMGNFRENIAVSFGYACKEYLKDMKSGGVVLLILLSIMALTIAFFVGGLTTALSIVRAMG